jgi:hypothetical protein
MSVGRGFDLALHVSLIDFVLTVLVSSLRHFANHAEYVLVACTVGTLPVAPASMLCIRCAPSTAPGTDSMSSLSFLTGL